MTVLIYFGCFFLESLAIVLIKYATSYDFLRMGAIPAMFVVGCTLWLSAHLCRKWDDHIALRERKAAFNSQRKLNVNSTQVATITEQQPKVETTTHHVESNKTELATRQKNKKNGGLIALCVVLIILVAGLSVVLFLSIKRTQASVAELNDTIEQLSKEKVKTERSLKTAQADRQRYIDLYNDVINSLNDAKSQISSLQRENATLKDKLANTDPDDVSYSDSFTSVNSLLNAVQKNPNAYNNKQVKVVGTMVSDIVSVGNRLVAIFDMSYNETIPSLHSAEGRYWAENKYNSKKMIDIVFADDAPSALLNTKDYVKIYGTVRISNGEVYLSNCDYEVISSNK